MEMVMQVNTSNWNKMAVTEHSISRNSQHWTMTGYASFLMVLMVLFASTKTTKAQAQVVEDIGSVSELRGSARVIRDDDYTPKVDFGIQSFDDVRTTNGRIAISFLDNSQVKLTEHSKLVIDEYIYDPNPSKQKMALKFASGTARFISGAFDKQRVNLKTPTANIAIRGTDFTCTVNELGESLIILLPDATGLSSGEIVVTTMAGQVVLNKPYEATTATMFEAAPSKPVILDLTLDQIDNMLIVNPPKEDERFQEQEVQTKQASYLDFDDLDIDYLNEDFLEGNELEFTELDINYLDVNFLEDLLNVLDALAIDEEEDVLAQATGINIQGTLIGKDPDTQITTIIQGQSISFRRQVSESVRLDVDGSGSYTIILIQDGVSNVIKVNGGSDTTITIKQSS
jgi:hypothetical protein